MRSKINRFFLLFLLLSFAFQATAQSGGGSSYLLMALVAIAVLIVLGAVIMVADNLLKIEARESGADKSGENYSIFPTFQELFGSSKPDFVDGKIHYLKRGHDILLEGEAQQSVSTGEGVTTFAVQPTNFNGISPIPKVVVAVGDEVKAGDPIFFDKKRPDIQYVAPVSGEVVAINRGAKRSISEVVILSDKEIKYKSFDAPNLEDCSREDLVSFLQGSGAWTFIQQRPYNIVANAADTPKGIYVSTFDSAPLAPNLNYVVDGNEAAFQKGLDVLGKFAPVHLGLNAKDDKPHTAFTDAMGVSKHWFHGKHPAGNVGVQIHHIDPISSNSKVWTLGVQDVITIGRLFTEGRFDASRTIAVTGAEVSEPHYIRTYLGANVAGLVKDNLKEKEDGKSVRYVSGDVLSGKQTAAEGHLGYYDDQLTVLEEGDDYELFGWLIPIAPRPTISGTFPNALYPDLKFEANTNTHGEKRAFVVTGQYESMLPMDIYPQHLMKAIITNDFERMEGLGIYELSEEDVALCEFACTSKQPLQSILREGLNSMYEQE
ncbi:MAG: Na(+)-translocating NADH-quinone reductase subunit A [Bacteroidota bacterium]